MTVVAYAWRCTLPSELSLLDLLLDYFLHPPLSTLLNDNDVESLERLHAAVPHGINIADNRITTIRLNIIDSCDNRVSSGQI